MDDKPLASATLILATAISEAESASLSKLTVVQFQLVQLIGVGVLQSEAKNHGHSIWSLPWEVVICLEPTGWS